MCVCSELGAVATTQLCSLDEAGCTITEDLPGALRRKAAAPRPAIVLQALRRLLTIVRRLLANSLTTFTIATAALSSTAVASAAIAASDPRRHARHLHPREPRHDDGVRMYSALCAS